VHLSHNHIWPRGNLVATSVWLVYFVLTVNEFKLCCGCILPLGC